MSDAVFIEDDPGEAPALSSLVPGSPYQVAQADSLSRARAALALAAPDLVLVEARLPQGTGFAAMPDSLPAEALAAEVSGAGSEPVGSIPTFAPLSPECTVPVVMVRSAAPDRPQLSKSQASGDGAAPERADGAGLAARVLAYKPLDAVRLRTALGRSAQAAELRREIAALRATLCELGRCGEMVGRSPAMQRLYEGIVAAAASDAPVMISGLSGTGKKLAARTVHQLGRRRKGPFVVLDCATLAPGLADAALFGQQAHGTPARAGAAPAQPDPTTTRAGAFEQARGGTLLLDNVTALAPAQQSALLRALESRVFCRLGDARALPVEFRLISISRGDPGPALQAQPRRRELWRRLKAITLNVPPLHQRGADVTLLASHFIDQLNRHQQGAGMARYPKRLSAACEAALLRHAWPGNVRELRTWLEHGYSVSDRVIEAYYLGDAPPAARSDMPALPGTTLTIAVGTQLADAERQLIEAALKASDGVRSRAAAMLGISQKTLYNKLKRFATTA
jgi:DNA-binding NtrC family response regulator